jgi:Rrf2 family protein
MQFTKAEEYGMQGVLHLAAQSRDKVIPLSEISEAQHIPEKFLAKIFQSLSKSGIIRSHRGVRGGFTLAKDPADITVREVLETIQGPYHLMKDESGGVDNNSGEFSALRSLVLQAERQLVKVFEEHTLADLIGPQDKRPVVSQ